MGAVELVKRAKSRGRDPVDTEGMIPFTRRYVDGPREISRRQAAAIRLAVWGGFVDVLDPVPLADACQRVGLQRRSAKRLLQSSVFVAALAEAQAERLAQEAARAPSLPLAVNPPVITPPPAGEAPEPAPAGSERDPAETFPMVRLPATDERHGSLARPPAGYVAPAAPVDGKILKSGVVEFDLRKHRERYPFAGDVATQRSTIIPRSPRRSLRKV